MSKKNPEDTKQQHRDKMRERKRRETEGRVDTLLASLGDTCSKKGCGAKIPIHGLWYIRSKTTKLVQTIKGYTRKGWDDKKSIEDAELLCPNCGLVESYIEELNNG